MIDITNKSDLRQCIREDWKRKLEGLDEQAGRDGEKRLMSHRESFIYIYLKKRKNEALGEITKKDESYEAFLRDLKVQILGKGDRIRDKYLGLLAIRYGLKRGFITYKEYIELFCGLVLRNEKRRNKKQQELEKLQKELNTLQKELDENGTDKALKKLASEILNNYQDYFEDVFLKNVITDYIYNMERQDKKSKKPEKNTGALYIDDVDILMAYLEYISGSLNVGQEVSKESLEDEEYRTKCENLYRIWSGIKYNQNNVDMYGHLLIPLSIDKEVGAGLYIIGIKRIRDYIYNYPELFMDETKSGEGDYPVKDIDPFQKFSLKRLDKNPEKACYLCLVYLDNMTFSDDESFEEIENHGKYVHMVDTPVALINIEIFEDFGISVLRYKALRDSMCEKFYSDINIQEDISEGTGGSRMKIYPEFEKYFMDSEYELYSSEEEDIMDSYYAMEKKSLKNTAFEKKSMDQTSKAGDMNYKSVVNLYNKRKNIK